jgi:hypothetical protein
LESRKKRKKKEEKGKGKREEVSVVRQCRRCWLLLSTMSSLLPLFSVGVMVNG